MNPETVRDTGDPVVEIRDLWKSFGELSVFRGISLEIRRGEAMAIIGGSGSGKSVLLKHIVGLLRPDRGFIRVRGTDFTTAHADEVRRTRQKIGYLFQDGALLNSISVFENVALPLREERRLGDAEIRERVMARLRMVGLLDAATRLPAKLSGGMRKRAGLARALVTDPEIVLYDEPTAGLDPLTARQIAVLIRDLHVRLQVTSVLVTHDMPLACTIADRVAMLSDGRIYWVGTPKEMECSEDPKIRAFAHATLPSPGQS